MRSEEGYRDPSRHEEGELDTVILERTVDPVRADLVRGLLEAADIVVSTPGYHARSMIGLGGATDIAIRIPRKDLDRARAVLEERNALSSKVTVRSPRRWRAASMVALVPGFGAGHVHAGAYLSALLLAASQVLVLVTAGSDRILYAGVAYLFPIVSDVWGSRIACERANAGTTVRWWVSPGAMLGVALVTSFLVVMDRWGAAWMTSPEMVTACEYYERCGGTPRAECLRVLAEVEPEGGYDPRCVECYAQASCEGADASCAEACGR